jgi:hypothetical protein
MSTVTEIKVFVSCPGDVKKEKDLVRQACEDLSHSFATAGKDIRFFIFDWLDLSRKFGEKPQEIINQIYAEYNIYIGILWNRYGTPTGTVNSVTGEDFRSGTEEEFDIAIKRYNSGEKLSIYFYFKEMSRPTSASRVQQGLVMDLQEQIKKDHHSWYDTFPETEESLEFYRKVNQVLNEYALNKEQEVKIETKDAVVSIITTNRPLVPSIANLSNATLIVSNPMQRHLISYIDLEGYHFPNFEEPKTQLLRDVVHNHRLIVVLGNPGSGKSAELSLLTEHFQSENSAYIPVFRKLNSYVDEDIATFLPEGWEAYPPDTLIVILDGLDEVQPQHFNTAVRKLQTFAERYQLLPTAENKRVKYVASIRHFRI